MPEIVTLRCLVAGRVQGVGYRAAAAHEARSLGLDGWVRNRQDGSVELVVAGAPAAVEKLVAWLWRGPRQSVVSGVELEQWNDAIEAGFRVLR